MKNFLNEKKDVIFSLVIFFVALVFLSRFINNRPPLDEGLLLYEGIRITKGDMPYRDFFELFWPGSIYFTALIFKLFGTQFAYVRIGFIIILAGAGVITYLLARKVINNHWLAVFPSLFFVFSATVKSLFFSYHWFSSFFFLLSVYLFSEFLEKEKRFLLILTGISIFATFFALQNKGFFLLLGFLFFFLVYKKKRLSDIFVLTASFIGVALPVFLYFHLNGALMPMLYNTITVPLTSKFYYPDYLLVFGNNPFGFFWNYVLKDFFFVLFRSPDYFIKSVILIIDVLLISYLPFIAYLVLGVQLFKERNTLNQQLLFLGIGGFSLLASVLYFPDAYHLAVACSISLVIITYFIGRGLLAKSKLARAVSIAFLIFFVISSIYNIRASYKHTATLEPVVTKRGTIYYVPEDRKPVADLLEYLKDKEFFAFGHAAIYYYWLDKDNPTPYNSLMTGYSPSSHYREVFKVMQAKKIKYVLYDNYLLGIKEKKHFYLKVNIKEEKMLDFLRENNYRQVLEFKSEEGEFFYTVFELGK